MTKKRKIQHQAERKIGSWLWIYTAARTITARKSYAIVQTMAGHILSAGSLKIGGGYPALKSDVPDLNYKVPCLRSGGIDSEPQNNLWFVIKFISTLLFGWVGMN